MTLWPLNGAYAERSGIMAEFYKFEIANWNEGTANLTLEQEAAYLRVVNAIRLAEQPITFNIFVLCGLWRCNERKAKRILDELLAAEKIRIEDGRIVNDKAVEDASALRGLRVERASAGRRGGIESGKVRSKSLETNDTEEAIASTREEKRREEKNIGADAPAKKSELTQIREHLTRVLSPTMAEAFIAHRNKLKKALTPRAAELIAAKLAKAPDPAACVDLSIVKGWQDVFPDNVAAANGRPATAGADWWGGKDL